MIDNIDKNQRTFETRLLFIKELFLHKYSEEEILKGSIVHKLKKSYEQYLDEVNRSVSMLRSQDPLKVLNRASKEK